MIAYAFQLGRVHPLKDVVLEFKVSSSSALFVQGSSAYLFLWNVSSETYAKLLTRDGCKSLA